ncbi:polysaccharide deacetylase family protein [Castellaniella sp. WN]
MNTNPRVPFRMSTAREHLAPPDGRALICHVVVNVEYWPFDQPMNRKLFQRPEGANIYPDIPNFGWYEYGMRCGLPRLFELFRSRGIPVSAAMNAGVIDAYPSVAERILGEGWLLMGHGLVQKAFDSVPDQPAAIKETLDKLERFSGRRARSWLGPGLSESLDTPDYLAEAGIEYIYDWTLDDLPEKMVTKTGVLFAIPYAIELNDVTIFCIARQEPKAYYELLRDTVDVFSREAKKQPRILTLALHPHIMGYPHRFIHLEKVVNMLQSRADTIFMTADQIGDWYKKQVSAASTGSDGRCP